MIVTLPKLAAEAVRSILGLRHAARLWILPRALDKPKSSFFATSSIFCAVDRRSGWSLAKSIVWYFAGSIGCLPRC